MGMGAEMLDDQYIAYELYCERVQRNINKGVWVTKDHRFLQIERMDVGHIENTIRMLERGNWEFAGDYIRLFKDELLARGYH